MSEYGKIYKRIWGDRDFKSLGPGEQLLYLKLVSQSDISHAGVLTLAPIRWAMQTQGLDVDDINDALERLADARFIVTDENTQELLIRSYIRNDLGWRSPKNMRAISSAVQRILSPMLRRVVSAELLKIDTSSLSTTISKTYDRSTKDYTEGEIAHLVAEFPPLSTPSEGLSDTPSEGLSDRGNSRRPLETATATAPETAPETAPAPIPSSSEIADAIPDREDVTSLCEHLARRIVNNGGKKPTIGKTWKNAARLILDRDQRDPDEAHRLIDWCQSDPFWMSNILSMPKFREKYDQLRLRAGTAIQPEPAGRYEPRQPTPEQQARIDEARARHEQRLRDAETERANELPTTQAERDAAAAKLREVIGL